MKNLGKYLYIIPIGIFGLMHMANASQMTGMVPAWMPLKLVIVYLAGLALIAATVALIINKKAKLAMTLLGVMLLLFVVLIHLMAVIGGDQMSMAMVLKDTSMAGAAFYLASQADD
jgi:putative oxidoreductase